MSHFTVGVITPTLERGYIEQIMAPYQENNMGDCPKEYLEFYDKEDELKDEYENRIVEEGDKTFSFKEKYATLEEFAKEWWGFKERDPETGRYGFWENPHAKWDWYEVGGRWANMLLVKDSVTEYVQGGHYGRHEEREAPEGYRWVDGARIKDIEFDKMEEYSRESAEKYWEEAQDKEAFEKRFIYGLQDAETKEQYIQRNTSFSTYAFLNGITNEWVSVGEMGWFGMSSETSEEGYNWDIQYVSNHIEPADPELYFVVIDCHI